MSIISAIPILSISTDKLQLIIANKENNDNIFNVLCYYEEFHSSIKNSHIVDAEGLILKIKKLIDKTNFFLNITIKNIFLIFPGTFFNIYESSLYLNISREGKEINSTDIKKLFFNITKEMKKNDHYLLNIFPLNFIVNNVKNIENPIGLIGKTLGVNCFYITSEKEFFSNLVHIIEQCGLKILDIFPSFYANYYAISLNEKINTFNIIDISNLSVSVVVFDNGIPFKYKLIKKGINDLYKILSEKYKISHDNVEELLENSIYIDEDNAEDIVIYKVKNNNEVIDITEQDLAQIISSYIKEIAEETKDFLNFFKDYTNNPLYIVGDITNILGYKSLINKLYKNYNLKYTNKNLIGLREYNYLHLLGALQLSLKRIKLLHNNYKPVKIENKIECDNYINELSNNYDYNVEIDNEKSLWGKIIGYFLGN